MRSRVYESHMKVICPFIFVMIIHDYWLFIILHDSSSPFPCSLISSSLISRDTQSSYTTKLRAEDPWNTRGPVDRGSFPSAPRTPRNSVPRVDTTQGSGRLFTFRCDIQRMSLSLDMAFFGRRRGLNKIDWQIDYQDYVTIVSKTGNRKTEKLQKWRLWRLLDSLDHVWIKNRSAPRRIWWRFMLVTV
jgi:hypothetical protein